MGALLDEDHARLQNTWKRALERMGWDVRTEVSFNVYGDRGRIDLLAFHPRHAVVLVVELKTAIADVQGLLGSLDVKMRLARRVSADLGWSAERSVPCLIVRETATARRRLQEHAALFAPFALRGRGAVRWLRDPGDRVTGLLILSRASSARRRGNNARGRLRVATTGDRGSVISVHAADAAESS